MADEDLLQMARVSHVITKNNEEQRGLSNNIGDMIPTDTNEEASYETKLYFKRWIILAMYFLLAIASSIHWMQYTIIVNIVSRYYEVSIFTVQWTALSVNIIYFVGVFPAMYIINRVGPRNSCLIVATLSCTVTWIKYFAVHPNRFIFALIGQMALAPCVIFVNQLSTMLASHWFGVNEVSTATSIACLGVILGVGVSNFLTPKFIQNHENLLDIEQDMSRYFLAIAISNTVLSIIVFIWFDNKPKLPPTRARLVQMHLRHNANFKETLKRLLLNKNFLLLWTAHGLGIGYVNSAVILIPLFVSNIEDGKQHVGNFALTVSLSGMVGTLFIGLILDRCKKYREVLITIYVCFVIGEGMLAGLLYTGNRWLLYFGWAFFGFFGLAYFTASLDSSVEITYPESEAFSTSLMCVANTLYGIFIGVVATKLLENGLHFETHVFYMLLLLFGLITTVLTKYKCQRQANNAKGRGIVMCEIQNNTK